jgi:hypothetical protein
MTSWFERENPSHHLLKSAEWTRYQSLLTFQKHNISPHIHEALSSAEYRKGRKIS